MARTYKNCECCGAYSIRIELHHIIPKRAGGSDEEDNLIPLCIGCHDLIDRSLLRDTGSSLLSLIGAEAPQMSAEDKRIFRNFSWVLLPPGDGDDVSLDEDELSILATLGSVARRMSYDCKYHKILLLKGVSVAADAIPGG